MHRRALLTSLAVGAATLAGCNGWGTGGNTETPSRSQRDVTPADTPTATPTETTTTTDTPTTTPSNRPLTTVWRQTDLRGKVVALTLDSTASRLLVGTKAGELLGIATDGTVEWREGVREPVDAPTELHVVGDALLVIGGDPAADNPYTTLTIRAATTGEFRWSDRRRELLSPLGVQNNTLYISGEYLREPVDEIMANEPVSRSGTVRAYDLADGSVRAELTIDSSFGATLAPHGLYIRRERSGTDGAYSVISYDLGLSKRWQVDTDSGYATELLTTDRGLLYPLGTQLIHWDAASGERVWTVTGFGERPVSPSRLPDGTVYAGSPVREIAPDGTVRRMLSLKVYGQPRLAPSGAAVYFDAGDKLTRVNRSTGQVAWSYRPTSSEYLYLVGLLRDAVIVKDDVTDAELIVLDPATGTERGRMSIEGTDYYESIASGGHLYLGTSLSVSAFEAVDGNPD